MAFSEARKELDCSVCLNIYTDPVTLKCGHNFCRECIERVLDTQEGSGGYCCPECRAEFQERPELLKNITLRNIMESFRSAEPEKKESQIFCTYCLHSPVPAVTSCLHCECSLCDNHLRVHSKSSQHVLSDLTTSLEKRKCSIHEKILEYYCTQDGACLCGSCRLHGEHEEHQVETLEEASKKRKENLHNALQKLLKNREEMEQSIKSLRTYKCKVQENAAHITKKVTTMFRDIRRQLDTLERTLLNKISCQAMNVSFPIPDLVKELEMKNDELSRKIRHIEEICNMMDPLTVLQKSDNGDLCDTEDGDNEDKDRLDKLLHDGEDLDVAELSRTLHTGLSDITAKVNGGIHTQEPADISLDEDTAHEKLYISDDRKTACRVVKSLNRPGTPKRFTWRSQVLSSQRFSSGRYYWDVDVGGSSHWRVGICYPSIERTALLGYDSKSWCLHRNSNQLSVTHNRESISLPGDLVTRVRICLDYEAGQICFYELCIPIRHLHTFTTTFTEPLHAGLYVDDGCIKICKGDREVYKIYRKA